MRAIAIHEGEDAPQLVDVPEPTPGEGEALIRTLRVGIDGTDYNVIGGSHGGMPSGDNYQILGHEAVGVVVDPNGTDVEEGAVVVPTVRREATDGSRFFANDEADMAPADEYVERGIAGAHGYMAEYFTSPASELVEVDESMAPHGFLVEPLSNAEKAIEHANVARSMFEWSPERALVLGNGSLGLLALATLAGQYDRLYCVGRRDRPDPTIDILERLGATYVDSRETPVDEIADVHEPVDLAFEATGYAHHSFELIDTLAPNGIGALLGIPADWTFELDVGRLHREMVLENKVLLGSVNSNRRHFEQARASLSTFPEWFLEGLVTDVFTPESVDDAFERDDGDIKSVVEFATLDEV